MTFTVPTRHWDRKAAGRPAKRQTKRPFRRDSAAGHRALCRTILAGFSVVEVETVVEVDAENVTELVVVVDAGTVVVVVDVVVVVGGGVGRRTAGANETGR